MRFVHSRRAVLASGVGAVALLTLGSRPSSAQKVEGEAAGELRIAFIGDSLADGLWGGIVRAVSRDRCLRGRINCGRFARNGTGLTRLDTFSWPSEARAVVERFSPHLVIVSLGLNDRQNIVDGARRAAWGTREWDERYMENVQAVARSAMSGGAQVLWIGLPALRDTTADQDARVKNVLFETALTQLGQPGARFVAPWRLSQQGEDAFQSYARAANGSMVQIRATDGVHFTSVGYDMIVAYLYPQISETLAAAGLALPACDAT